MDCCCYDVMNHVDCVKTRDVTRRKYIHVLKIPVVNNFCSKTIRSISKYIYRGRYCMDIHVVEG